MTGSRAHDLHAQIATLLAGETLGDSAQAVTLTLAGIAMIACNKPEQAGPFLQTLAADAARVTEGNWAMKPALDAQIAAVNAAAKSKLPN